MEPFINNDETLEERVFDFTERVDRFKLLVMIELGSDYQLNNCWALCLNVNYMTGFDRVIYTGFNKPDPYDHRLNISLGVKYAIKSE
ncbi:hypothetical protein HNS38_00810 [Lentimicrobium sp. L6]|uniref:hypothetical protein n=1 Tax=Lentimicrobium sp. L6 TaxID=2735916 RepID=UPI001552E5F8|nr:hypothetical protein [Lentimicrobium sp. L6]NPD83277.1 hypothetical protein [Lentimicrobium sp. L6]